MQYDRVTGAPVYEVNRCQVCQEPQIGETLSSHRAACGCYVQICKSCTRHPGTVGWMNRYASQCLTRAGSLARDLSA